MTVSRLIPRAVRRGDGSIRAAGGSSRRTLGSALGVVVVALAVAVSLTAASGQEAGALQIAAVAHDPAGAVTVTLMGRGASELPAGAVSASLAEVDLGPATLAEGAGGPAAKSVVLAIETSSSMLLGRLERAQAMALVTLVGLEAVDRVAVVGFGDEARVISEFTTERAETRAAIESLTPGSSARLYAGVETAAGLLGSAEAGGKALVVFGWGWEFGGGVSGGRPESATAGRESGAAIFWVPVGRDFDAAYFDDLTRSTGGRQLTASEAGGLGAELAATVHDTRSFRFETPVLAAGARPLLVSVDGVTLATTLEVSNDGLIRIGSVEQAGPGEPLVVSIESMVAVSSLEIEVRSGGQLLAVDAGGGAVRIDPWAFAPGALDVLVTARVGGEVASTETISLEVESLEPELVVEPVEADGARAVEVSWRAQGAAGATLLVSIDGAAVLRTEERSAMVPAPGGGAVEASLESAEGATLISWAGVVKGAGEAGAGSSVPTLPGVAGLLAALGVSALAIVLLVRRARVRGRASSVDAVTATDAREEPGGGDVGSAGDRQSMPPTPLRVAVGEVGRELDDAVETRRPRGAVVVRDPGGREVRVPIRSGQISVGASNMCDVTLVGGDVRPVHVILAASGDFTHRVLPLGRVSLVESGEELDDGALITARQWLALGDHLVCIESW